MKDQTSLLSTLSFLKELAAAVCAGLRSRTMWSFSGRLAWPPVGDCHSPSFSVPVHTCSLLCICV